MIAPGKLIMLHVLHALCSVSLLQNNYVKFTYNSKISNFLCLLQLRSLQSGLACVLRHKANAKKHGINCAIKSKFTNCLLRGDVFLGVDVVVNITSLFPSLASGFVVITSGEKDKKVKIQTRDNEKRNNGAYRYTGIRPNRRN